MLAAQPRERNPMADLPAPLIRKMVPAEQVRCRDWPRPLVFTNGVFDVLHRGHVLYLDAARELGAALLVAVNSDSSVRQLGKGPDRPLNREIDRLLVVAALESVSFVTIFEESTPCELLKSCRPQVYVKGGDYDMETLEEAQLMRTWGGRSVSIPFVPGYSTSVLVQRIRGGS
jgi:rfaE bifunctional protein nucleotidyltransferase chain/domain